MEQVSQIVDEGQRNYTLVHGGTGPLVYPAGHVAIFSVLWAVTEKGTDFFKAQYIFLGLYILTHAIVLLFVFYPTDLCVPANRIEKSHIYKSLNKHAKLAGFSIKGALSALPSYVWFVPLLALSKRLHSIYMLRLFNDCFGTLFSVISVALLQRHRWTLSAIFLSLGVSVKMNSLLYLPGAAVIYLQALGLSSAVFKTAVPFLVIQLVVALPFILDLSELKMLLDQYLPSSFKSLESLEPVESFLNEHNLNSLSFFFNTAKAYMDAVFSMPINSVFKALSHVSISPYASDYFSKAFEFSRVFFYKWTVNWRFVPESIFLSKPFALTLLAVHLFIIGFGFCLHRAGWWMSPLRPSKALALAPASKTSKSNPSTQKNISSSPISSSSQSPFLNTPASSSQFELPALINALFFENSGFVRSRRVSDDMSPSYILSTLITSNLVGVLCARSLHYQFYSWFYWSVPYAAYTFSKSYGIIPALLIWAAEEWAWLQYPSTSLSSLVVVFSLATWVWGFWKDEFVKYTWVRSEIETPASKKNV